MTDAPLNGIELEYWWDRRVMLSCYGFVGMPPRGYCARPGDAAASLERIARAVHAPAGEYVHCYRIPERERESERGERERD